MSCQPVRNFKLPVIVFKKATTFEYCFCSPYTNLHFHRFKFLMSVKVPDNKTFGVFGRM